MRAGAEVGVMQPPSEHEGLAVGRRNVSRHLLEAMFRLVGILIGQRGQAAEPGVRRQRIGIEALIDVANDAAGESHVTSLCPRHDALADDVEHRGAVVVVPPVPRCLEELADLDLDAVAQLQRPVNWQFCATVAE